MHSSERFSNSSIEYLPEEDLSDGGKDLQSGEKNRTYCFKGTCHFVLVKSCGRTAWRWSAVTTPLTLKCEVHQAPVHKNSCLWKHNVSQHAKSFVVYYSLFGCTESGA